MTQTAAGLAGYEDGLLLLLDELLVQVEVISLQDLIATVVYRDLK